jgi:hypothetical protein
MLVSSDESIPFLNPDTYLNHLPPGQGAAIEFTNEISLFILGVSEYAIEWLWSDSIREGGSVGHTGVSQYRYKDSKN